MPREEWEAENDTKDVGEDMDDVVDDIGVAKRVEKAIEGPPPRPLVHKI